MNLEVLKNSKIAVVFVEVENYTRLSELVDMFKDCPRTIFLSALSASNLIAIIVGEDISSLESTVGFCSPRAQKGVRRSDIHIGDLPIYPKFLPIRIHASKDAEIAPCGFLCEECKQCKENKCLGCPATKFYKGSL